MADCDGTQHYSRFVVFMARRHPSLLFYEVLVPNFYIGSSLETSFTGNCDGDLILIEITPSKWAMNIKTISC